MLKLSMKKMWLIFALALSGCVGSGNVRQPVCPVLPPAPASLMQPPTTEQKVRQELYEQPQKQTQRSAPSKTS